jgi:hypothetical protein
VTDKPKQYRRNRNPFANLGGIGRCPRCGAQVFCMDVPSDRPFIYPGWPELHNAGCLYRDDPPLYPESVSPTPEGNPAP